MSERAERAKQARYAEGLERLIFKQPYPPMDRPLI